MADPDVTGALVSDDQDPDEDDFDTTEYADPDAVEPDAPPEHEGDDTLIADDAPAQTPAAQDAPPLAPDPGIPLDPGIFVPEPGLPPILISGEDAADEAVRRRWLGLLRFRQEMLAHARDELAHATTAADKRAAQKKVKEREEQVAYAQRVLERRKTTVIERVVRAAMLGVNNEAAIHYSQDLTLRWSAITQGLRSKNGQFPRQADCSSFVTWCYWDALGGPSAGDDILNGSGWSSGNTTSLMRHGQEVSLDNARRGDLCFYGSGSTEHVTVIVAPGKVASHGQENGPRIYSPPNYRAAHDLKQVRRYVA